MVTFFRGSFDRLRMTYYYLGSFDRLRMTYFYGSRRGERLFRHVERSRNISSALFFISVLPLFRGSFDRLRMTYYYLGSFDRLRMTYSSTRTFYHIRESIFDYIIAFLLP